ncbi:MAG TPA: cyclic lactone autoinducer peptide [Bacillota bacterium]|jgi:cyclic lactone autoinducer peptide|nr:cyclic lactone autoinducer peptide [Peptococcaceae bacterium MAG4]NLW37255.1 cyclic lactone autoinducer peptide [Peptococcaceae bacterium]HUM59401.1 cyclic lactone autoinducer peptide [Bacillota bacterium]
MKYRIFGFVVTLLLLLANIASAAPCSVSQYQTAVPESLRR